MHIGTLDQGSIEPTKVAKGHATYEDGYNFQMYLHCIILVPRCLLEWLRSHLSFEKEIACELEIVSNHTAYNFSHVTGNIILSNTQQLYIEYVKFSFSVCPWLLYILGCRESYLLWSWQGGWGDSWTLDILLYPSPGHKDASSYGTRSPKDGHVPDESAPSRWSCKRKSKPRATYAHGLHSRR